MQRNGTQDHDLNEKLKQRTFTVMQLYAGQPLESLAKPAVDSLVKAELQKLGVEIPGQELMARARKLTAAGMAPKAMMPGELEKEASKLPRMAHTIVHERLKKLSVSSQATLDLDERKTKKESDKRRRVKLADPDISADAKPVRSEVKVKAGELTDEAEKWGITHIVLFRKKGTWMMRYRHRPDDNTVPIKPIKPT